MTPFLTHGACSFPLNSLSDRCNDLCSFLFMYFPLQSVTHQLEVNGCLVEISGAVCFLRTVSPELQKA